MLFDYLTVWLSYAARDTVAATEGRTVANVNLISVSVTDDAGKTGSILVPVPTTHTLAEIQTFVSAMLPNLDAVTGAKITGARVTLQLTLPGALKANAIADHPLGYGANFAFSAANTTYRHSVRVPSLDQGLISGGEVNVADALITTWTGQMVSGNGVVSPTDKYANDLTGFLGAEVKLWK